MTRDGSAHNSIHDSSLCIDCGLCCDGTMFAATDFTEDGEVASLRSLGAVLINDSGSRFFLQRCPGFNGSSCSVYESRPHKCSSYECALLRSTSSGETPVDDARRTIDRARSLAEAVRARIDSDKHNTSEVIRIGEPSLSSYLSIMNADYASADLMATFPEAAELIDILNGSFGWNGGRPPAEEGHTISGK
jgi:uncharacterized protein